MQEAQMDHVKEFDEYQLQDEWHRHPSKRSFAGNGCIIYLPHFDFEQMQSVCEHYYLRMFTQVVVGTERNPCSYAHRKSHATG